MSISVYARRRAKAGLLPPALAGAASGAQRTRRVAALEGWHLDPYRGFKRHKISFPEAAMGHA